MYKRILDLPSPSKKTWYLHPRKCAGPLPPPALILEKVYLEKEAYKNQSDYPLLEVGLHTKKRLLD